MKKMFLTACTLAALVAPAMASEGWTMDFPAALEQAAKENKAVMVDFNGSDWCGPCIALKSKVLDTPAFAAYAKDKFVLVDIDMPRGDKISEAQKAKNKAMCEQYAIIGYPTILVMNKEGVVVGGFIGGKTDIAQVQAELEAALQNLPKANEAMEAAAGLTGVGRAQALMSAYELVPEGIRANNATLRAQIIEADPSDTCGLVAAEEAKAAKQKAQAEMMKRIYSAPVTERAALIEKELARTDLSADQRVSLLQIKLNSDLMACKTADDLAAVRLAFKAFAEANPSEKAGFEDLLANFLSKEDAEILKYLEASRLQQAAMLKAAKQAKPAK